MIHKQNNAKGKEAVRFFRQQFSKHMKVLSSKEDRRILYLFILHKNSGTRSELLREFRAIAQLSEKLQKDVFDFLQRRGQIISETHTDFIPRKQESNIGASLQYWLKKNPSFRIEGF